MSLSLLEQFVTEALSAPAPKADASSLKAFMDDLLKIMQVYPFDERFVCKEVQAKDGTEALVLMQIYPFDGKIHVASIEVHPPEMRGKGVARSVMNELMNLADKHDVSLDLDVQPFGKGGLNKRQLTSFYSRLGFDKVGSGGRMVRKSMTDYAV